MTDKIYNVVMTTDKAGGSKNDVNAESFKTKEGAYNTMLEDTFNLINTILNGYNLGHDNKATNLLSVINNIQDTALEQNYDYSRVFDALFSLGLIYTGNDFKVELVNQEDKNRELFIKDEKGISILSIRFLRQKYGIYPIGTFHTDISDILNFLGVYRHNYSAEHVDSTDSDVVDFYESVIIEQELAD